MADKDKEKDAAAEAAEEGAEAAEPKKRSPIIFIVIGVVVALLLAAGISIFITTQLIAGANQGGGGDDGGGDGRHHDAGIFLKLGDPKEGILVNVGGPRGGKFLKAGIVLEMNPGRSSVINEETKTFLPDAEIRIMDITMQFLRSTKVEDFAAEKQDELKKQLKDALNAELGSGSVYDIYITSFLLQ